MIFRELLANEVECRVGTCRQNGLSLLLYKTARVDAEVLDETIGPENWQCEFYECKGTLFCRVGIRCGDEWVWKSDAGSPSSMESQKGEASDAFKRACFRWGIGRELYTAPFVWIANSCDRVLCSIVKKNNGSYTCYDRFVVTGIEMGEGRITYLQIANADIGMVVWEWRSNG